MQPAANAPRSFSVMNIESSALVGRPFKTMYAATKASWKLGGDATGLDHTVVGLDADGAAWEIEVMGQTDRSNPTGYRLSRLIGARTPRARRTR